jgi:hypothetical protein
LNPNGRAGLLNAIHAKLIDWGIAPDAFTWPPRHNPKALPYPGLDAFDEDSAGIFFGREVDVMAGIRDLRQIRHRGSPRLLVIQAASGAGKSSFLRAGLCAARANGGVRAACCRPPGDRHHHRPAGSRPPQSKRAMPN